jgi:hypothetical protein
LPAHISTAVVATPDSSAFLIAIVLSGLGALVIATLLADRGGLLPASPVSFGRWTATVAMALSLGAAAIHFAVFGEHFAEYAPYGIAFTALAWFQVGWAVGWVVERRRSLALVAIVVNGGALLVWAASRTVGLPIGPVPGELEPVGPLDLLAGALEVAIIGVLAWDVGMRAIRYRPALSAAGATLVVGSVALAVVLATSVALASAGGSDHHHGAVADEMVVPDSGDGLTPGSPDLEPGDSGNPAPESSPYASGSAVPSIASSPSLTPSNVPSAAAAPSAGPTARASGTARPTTRPATRPATPRPATPRPSTATRHPGVIVFGSTLDATGGISQPDNQFREGETAVWVADLSEAPGVPEIRKEIVQVLPDGREFEHWREQVPLSDPGATRLVGQAELSLYAHGGVGSYRLRYLRGDELLAEGTFELVP